MQLRPQEVVGNIVEECCHCFRIIETKHEKVSLRTASCQRTWRKLGLGLRGGGRSIFNDNFKNCESQKARTYIVIDFHLQNKSLTYKNKCSLVFCDFRIRRGV